MEIGFPWLLSDKDSTCNAGDIEDVGPLPGLGRSPGGGNVNPLQYSRLENPMDWEAWWAAVHGVVRSQTRLSDFTFTFFHICYVVITDPLQWLSEEGGREGRMVWWESYTGCFNCIYNVCMHAKSLQSCLTLPDPVDSSLPASSVHGIP